MRNILKWRWGGRTASGDGSVRTIFLGGKSRGSVASATRVFLSGNHISDEQRDKEPVVFFPNSLPVHSLYMPTTLAMSRKMRRNLRNLSEESRGRRRRENFNEEHRKAETIKAREKHLFTMVRLSGKLNVFLLKCMPRCLTCFVKLLVIVLRLVCLVLSAQRCLITVNCTSTCQYTNED